MASAAELVSQAKAEGMAVDSYSFAEWLVDEKEYYGDPERLMEYGQLEEAWVEAEAMWARHA